MQQDLSPAVEAFLKARRARPAWLQPPEPLWPSTPDHGYRVQAAVADHLGEQGIRRIGYKVGSTSAEGQRGWGINEPVYGALFEDTFHASLADAMACRYTRPKAECEIAVKLSRDIPEGADEDTVRAALEWARLGCEIIDIRPSEPKAESVPVLLADGFFNAGVVLGPAIPDWRERDLTRLTGTIEVDGEVFTGSSGVGLAPVASVQWLAHALGRIGRGLRAGDIVFTGSLVPPVALPAQPNRFSLAIEGFGRMALDSGA